MNALVSIETLKAEAVFVPGGIAAIISKIEAEVRAEAFDVSTEEGRDRIKSVAYKVARSKTALDDLGKDLVADIKKQAGAIDADRRTARDRLDALKDEVRAPLTAWEQAEELRVKEHAGALVAVVQGHLFDAPPTSAQIMDRQTELSRLVERDWQEFHDRASEAYQVTFPRLEEMRIAAEQSERDLAELETLRAEKATRDAADLAERQKAAAAQQEAARKADQERKDRERAEQQAERDRQHAEQAAAEAIAAAARAVDQERERVARVKADEERAAAKREANKKHRAKVHKEIGDALATEAGLTAEQIELLFEALAADRIPHVSITY